MAGAEATYVEALAVKDGKIAFAGSKSNALKMKGDVTKIVDLGGKTLLPGFIDGHSHYINSLLVADQCKLYSPPSGPGKDVPSIIAELKRYATERKIPKGEMIMGYGYDDTMRCHHQESGSEEGNHLALFQKRAHRRHGLGMRRLGFFPHAGGGYDHEQ